MPTWPASLPQTLQINFQRKRQSGKVRSDMDTGPAKQRPRFDATVRYFTGDITLTGAQLATLDAFYEDELGQGAASFDWIDPVTDAPCLLRFKDDPEEISIVAHDDPDKRLYVIRLSLEKRP